MSVNDETTRSGGWALGIDIGGSSVKLALVCEGSEPHTMRGDPYEMPTLEVLTSRIRQTFDALLKQSGVGREAVARVGVSVAGPMNKAGVLEGAANLPHLVGVSIPQWTEETLGLGVPVRPATDANSAAACEHRRNPMPGRTLYLSMGTGVGGAVLDDGRPVIITRGTSGHFGHMDVSGGEADAPATPGAGRGALEAYVGFRTLEADGVPVASDERFEHPTMKTCAGGAGAGDKDIVGAVSA